MLTDKQCKNAGCPAEKKRVRFTDSGGLYLEVSPAGSKRWFWKMYANRKEGRMAPGSYPSVSLAEARRARDAAKLQKAEGKNPVQVRRTEKLKAINPAGDTFKIVVLEWHGKQTSQWSDGHAKRALRQLERDLFPWIGSRRLQEIEPVELLATLRKIGMSRSIRSLATSFFSRSISPCSGFITPLPGNACFGSATISRTHLRNTFSCTSRSRAA